MTSTQALWYNRPGSAEDPWISVTDHSPAIAACDIVHGENSFFGGHNCIISTKGGA